MRVRLSNQYKSGDHLVTCDRCGFTIYASESKKTWDGLVVCEADYEPRHPQDLVRPRADNQSVKDPRPPPETVFMAIACTAVGQSGYAEQAKAGCAIVDSEPTLS